MSYPIDKLQRYAAMQVDDRKSDVIVSRETRSFYYNFHGNTLRISDHLPLEGSGVTMSIIMTSDPNVYVMNQHKTGRLTVLNYEKAKEVVRTFKYMADIFRRPEVPFAMEKDVVDALTSKNGGSDTILGVPSSAFSPKQVNQITSFKNQVLENHRTKVKEAAAAIEEHTDRLKIHYEETSTKK